MCMSQIGLLLENGCGAKLVAILNLIVVEHMWGTFHLVVFKVIWGHSMHLSQNDL